MPRNRFRSRIFEDSVPNGVKFAPYTELINVLVPIAAGDDKEAVFQPAGEGNYICVSKTLTVSQHVIGVNLESTSLGIYDCLRIDW